MSVDFQALVDALNVRIGETTAPTVTEIDKSLIRKFAIAIGDTNPRSLEGLLAPPTFINALMNGHWPDIVPRGLPLPKELHAGDELTLHRDIGPGDVLTAYARFTGAWLKESPKGVRLFHAAEFVVEDQAGETVAHVELVSCAFD